MRSYGKESTAVGKKDELLGDKRRLEIIFVLRRRGIEGEESGADCIFWARDVKDAVILPLVQKSEYRGVRQLGVHVSRC